MKIAFLLYVPRSGSTLFSKKLSDSSLNIYILPETRTVEYLLGIPVNLSSALGKKDLMRIFSSDYQLKGLGFTDENLSDLAAGMAGKDLQEMFLFFLQAMVDRSGAAPDICLVKNGKLLSLSNKILSLFPDAFFLHVMRDPRGSVNSMIHQQRVYFPKEKMARGDARFAARIWTSYINSVKRLKKRVPAQCLEVQYETLVMHPEKTIAGVFSFLGINPSETNSLNAGYRVSDKEKQLHPLIHGQTVNSRIEGWREELTEFEGKTVEWTAGDLLAEKGYQPFYFAAGHPPGLFFKTMATLDSLRKAVMYYFRRVEYFLKNPATFMLHLRLFIERRRQR